MPLKGAFFLILISVLLIISSCSNMTKEQYLSEYKSFINSIKEDRNTYTEKDWQIPDKKFYQFSEVLYKKFENELMIEEKIVLAKYRIEYDVFRYSSDAKETILELFNIYTATQEDINIQNKKFLLKNKDELKNVIENYIKNDLEKDADFVANQTKNVKDAFSKILNEIIEDDS